MNILLINGPNLNLLGTREPEIYGNKTLTDIEKDLTKVAKENSLNLECFQSNHEGEIVDKIHESVKNIQGILINAGAFTHTSISIRDALIGSKIPFVELHISNIFREFSLCKFPINPKVSGFTLKQRLIKNFKRFIFRIKSEQA